MGEDKWVRIRVAEKYFSKVVEHMPGWVLKGGIYGFYLFSSVPQPAYRGDGYNLIVVPYKKKALVRPRYSYKEDSMSKEKEFDKFSKKNMTVSIFFNEDPLQSAVLLLDMFNKWMKFKDVMIKEVEDRKNNYSHSSKQIDEIFESLSIDSKELFEFSIVLNEKGDKGKLSMKDVPIETIVEIIKRVADLKP